MKKRVIYEFEIGDKVQFDYEGRKLTGIVSNELKSGALQVVSSTLELFSVVNDDLRPLENVEEMPEKKVEQQELNFDVIDSNKGYSKTQFARQHARDIYEAYCERGKTAKEIGKVYDVSDVTARRIAQAYAKENNLRPRAKNERTLARRHADEILKKRKDGLTLKEIARCYRVSPGLISNICEENKAA